MDEGDMLLTVSCIMIGMVIGLFLAAIITSNGGNQVVKTDLLDNICERTYGIGYRWVDNNFGAETKIVCQKSRVDKQVLAIYIE